MSDEGSHAAAPRNPYGPRPGGGISLPDYYRPWPAIKNRNFYAPGTEVLPNNEMRISFMGSAPFPVSKEQSNAAHADRRYWRADQSPGVDREVRRLHRVIGWFGSSLISRTSDSRS